MNKVLAKRLRAGDKLYVPALKKVCTVESTPRVTIPADGIHKETVLVDITLDATHHKMNIAHRSLQILGEDLKMDLQYR